MHQAQNFSKAPASIYYHSSIKSKDITLEHKKLLLSVLKKEQLPGVKLEKLKNHKVYSIRLDKKARILFSFFAEQGVQNILVLELLDDHKYEVLGKDKYKESKALQENVRKQFLENKAFELQDGMTGDITEDDFSDCNDLPLVSDQLSDLENVAFVPVHHNHGNYIVLDESQESALVATTPAIIIGSPGSGKTILAAALWEQAVRNQQKVLMLAQSANLVKEIARELEKSFEYVAAEALGSRVITYKALLDQILGDGAVSIDYLQGRALFEEWFEERAKNHCYDKAKSTFFSKNWGLVYQEFRTMTGYTREEYTSTKGVGLKQCWFQDQKEREWLSDSFIVWKQYLAENNYKLCEFYEIEEKSFRKDMLFDTVILDESPDLSHVQLLNLYRMAKNANILCCADPKQQVNDENSKITYLKNMLAGGAAKRQVAVVELSKSYRCPAEIMKLAFEVDTIRQMLGRVSKIESKLAASKNVGGEVRWLDPNEKSEIAKVLLSEMQCMKGNIKACVIVSKDLLNEAKDLLKFEDYQYFSPEEAKGLEFEWVIAYQPLNTPKWYKINEILGKPLAVAHEDVESSAAIASFFVTCTRSQKVLVLLQEKSHMLRYVSTRLAKHVTLEADASHVKAQQLVSQPSSKEALMKHAESLAQQGLVEKAKSILSKTFGMDGERVARQFNVWGLEFKETILEAPKQAPSLVKKAPNESGVHPKLLAKDKKVAAPKSKPVLVKAAAEPKILGSVKSVPPKVSVKNAQEEAKKEKLGAELKKACLEGEPSSVQRVLKKVKKSHCQLDINQIFTRPYGGRTVLHETVDRGFFDVAKELLKVENIDINAREEADIAPLHLAVFSCHQKIVALLLKQPKIKVNVIDDRGNTALHYLAINEKSEEDVQPVLEMLLAYNATKVNEINDEGNTPLHLAAKNDKKRMVEALLSRKDIDLEIINHQGCTPLQLCEQGTATSKIIEEKQVGQGVPQEVVSEGSPRQRTLIFSDSSFKKTLSFKRISSELQDKLLEMGLEHDEMPDDVDSLYRAVGISCYLNKPVQVLRMQVAECVDNNRDKLKVHEAKVIKKRHTDFEQFIAAIKSGIEPAGDFEVMILMRIYEVPIYIVEEEGEIVNERHVPGYQGKPIFVYCNGFTESRYLHYDALKLTEKFNINSTMEQLTQTAKLRHSN